MRSSIYPGSPMRSKHGERAGAFKGFSSRMPNAEMTEAESGPLEWLGKAYHGERDYMAKHGIGRTIHLNSFPGTLRMISRILRRSY